MIREEITIAKQSRTDLADWALPAASQSIYRCGLDPVTELNLDSRRYGAKGQETGRISIIQTVRWQLRVIATHTARSKAI